MPVTIRPFTPEDYRALAELGTTYMPMPAEEIRYWDEQNRPPCLRRRWLAEADGRVVGMGEYAQFAGRYHPRKFVLDIWVHPEYQRRGIGRSLWELVTSSLAEHDPIEYLINTREDLPHSMRFVAALGFEEVMRSWESQLDLTTYDPARFAHLDRCDLTIKSLTELADDPERDRKLYELVSAVRQDVPTYSPLTSVPFEMFVERNLQNPWFISDAYLVAVDGDKYVGVTSVNRAPDDGPLQTRLTGVLREYRRRGVAMALKLRLLAWAHANGYASVKTHNATNNRPMLAINELLGFVKKPAIIDYVKVLKAE